MSSADQTRVQRIQLEAYAMMNDIKDARIPPATIEEKYSFLSKEAPTLFKKIREKTVDDSTLTMMFRHINLVNDGTMSKHDASVAVGTVLVDRFVKPSLANPPAESSGFMPDSPS